jgi:hypothetical protein
MLTAIPTAIRRIDTIEDRPARDFESMILIISTPADIHVRLAQLLRSRRFG